jgi:selenocysteine-specific elongation factor
MTAPAQAKQHSIIVGTAGHIDHGKTLLVRALTGVDTDRLPEEKRRGITVDLGFARCDLESPSGLRLALDIIDVPGHKQFVRNMLAGAGGIDLVMLVISAAEGVMPQTEEHLAICDLLGIRRGLVVLSKADLVSEEQLGMVCEEVRAALQTSFLRDAPIVSVSAHTGFGMAAVRRALARLAEQTAVRSHAGLPRLPLDRAFVMKGFGTVVTGTLQSGMLKVGETLTMEPGGKPVRIRGLQRQGRSCTEALAGSRVALNLSGVEVGEVRRGDTLVVASTPQAIDMLDAEITLLPEAPQVTHRARVRLHSFTSETIATVSIYGYHPVAGGASQIVRLKLAKPIVLIPGDRFVLRRLSPAQTIGGGRVIDAHPAPRTAKKKAFAWLQKVLATMNHGAEGDQLQLRVERCASTGIALGQLAHETGWSVAAVRAAVQPGLSSGSLRLLSEKLLISSNAWQIAGETMLKLVPAASAGGSALGIRQSELRSQSQLPLEVFAALLTDLAQQRRVSLRGESGNEMVYPPGAAVDAPDPNAGRIAALAELYQRAALNPPALAEAIRVLQLSEKEARMYVTLLLRNKTFIKLGADEIFMHHLPLAALEQTIRKLKGQTLDVGRLKQITGLSRKFAIPLLEHLDRQRITRRDGATRIIL